ncbi:MAG: hypothetical protein FJ135_08340 [Deltaproteobacteria bacterium]|nr:hypothetical protein [Deltaproteobacteria bacterium]
MHLREIISTLMLSDFYFSLPLWERKEVVLRLWRLYGAEMPASPEHSQPLRARTLRAQDHWPKG